MALTEVLASGAFDSFCIELKVRLADELSVEEVFKLERLGLMRTIAIGIFERVLHRTWDTLRPELTAEEMETAAAWRGRPGLVFEALCSSKLFFLSEDGRTASADRWWETLPHSIKTRFNRKHRRPVDSDDPPGRTVGFSLPGDVVTQRVPPRTVVTPSASQPHQPELINREQQAAAAAAPPPLELLAKAARWLERKGILGGVGEMQAELMAVAAQGRAWEVVEAQLECVVARQIVLGKPVRSAKYLRGAVRETPDPQLLLPFDGAYARHLVESPRIGSAVRQRAQVALQSQAAGASHGVWLAYQTLARQAFPEGDFPNEGPVVL